MNIFTHKVNKIFFTIIVNFAYKLGMRHPGIDIADIIKEQGRTQKKFAFLA